MSAVKKIDDNLHIGSLIAGNARRLLQVSQYRNAFSFGLS